MALTEVTKALATDETLQALVDAVEELALDNIGDVSALETEDKTSVVAAVNEIKETTVTADNIAVIEEGDTASQAYSIGDYFYLTSECKMCKAKTAIAIGDEFIEDTNYTIVTFGDELSNKVNKEAGKGLSTNDYTAGDKAKVGKIDETTTHVSGNPISISGLKSNQLAINPVITLEPIQAGTGTPSPVNQRPISGYDKIEVLSCGKNLYADGDVVYTGQISKQLSIRLKAGTYKLSAIVTSADTDSNSCLLYDTENNISLGTIARSVGSARVAMTLNLTKDTSNITFYASTSYQYSQGDAFSFKDIQLEESASATTYVPYHKATSISESLGQTVYGGSLDLRSGKLTGTKIKKILNGGSSESWTVGSVGTSGKYLHRLTGFTNDIPETERVVCNEFYGIAYSERNFENNNICWLDPDDNYVNVVSSSYTDLTSWQNFLSSNPLELCYSVSPFTIQLTPHEISLLKDYAYVSTNGTNISLDYHNGEMASLADVSQLGETVNELGEYVDRNSMGTYVDVKSYTESNPYKFVSDGYVYISSQGAISGTIEVFVMGSNGIIAARIRHQIHAAYEDENLFVKRGMYLYVSSCPSQCFVQFSPIV